METLFSVTWVYILTGSRPNCYECDQNHSCNCAAKNFMQVPVVPTNVLALDLSFNDIVSVEQNDLSTYTELKMLNLQKNKLRIIHTEHLNLLGNLYTTLRSVPLFQFAENMGSLKFGNLSLKEVKKNVVNNLMHLDEMMFVGTNLKFYETGSFKKEDSVLVSKILRDIFHPETSLTLRDVILDIKYSLQPFKDVRKGGTTRLTMNNMSTTDETITCLLEIMNGSPLSYVGLENIKLRGFLLKCPFEVSVINSTVFVMPCTTSVLGFEPKSFIRSNCPRLPLVVPLARLTFLDMSYNNFMTMLQKWTWPANLIFLNLSATKLQRVTPCLPGSLTVLDLSKNDLTFFHHDLPNLKHLHLSGNRFIRFPVGGRFPSLEVLSDLMGFKNLQYLEAGQNNFICTCELVRFFRSKVDHLVTLGDGYHSYVCDSPFTLSGHTVKGAQLSVFECHMTCAISILCTLIILSLVLVSVACHKLHIIWYLQMTIACLRMKQKPAIHRAGVNFCYDAFVSYSQ
uniref:Toll-like receptor 2 n=1 Tax=Electrophorus electricus TaxID=8005 RepID=A0AAY5ESW4_ELEEL